MKKHLDDTAVIPLMWGIVLKVDNELFAVTLREVAGSINL